MARSPAPVRDPRDGVLALIASRSRAARHRHPRRASLAARLAFAVVLLAAPSPARAQPQTAAEPGSELTVYHVVMGQGTLVWERFGHNALWIRDRGRGTDVAYNWGLFSFDEPGFLRRFLLGHMTYWMGGFDAAAMIEAYARENRSVSVQELRLTNAQKVALRDFVEWNALPENRSYRYDYYRDNCSTRVRDALDRVLGGRIRALTDTVMTDGTYRWHTRRLLAEDPVMYAGTQYLMGEPTDRPITVWEEMFLPVRMQHHLREVRVPDESGALVPLVLSERVVFDAGRRERDTAPSALPWFLALGTFLGAVLALSGARSTGRGGRAAFASLGTAWCTLAGVLGTGLVLAWLFTDHVFTYWNENVLQLSPVALALVVLLPRAALTGRGGPTARALALLVAGLSVLGLLIQPLPWFDQVSGEIIALALPANLGLAIGAWGLTRGPRAA